MLKTISLGIALSALMATGAGGAAKADAPHAQTVLLAQAPRPVHAVLRYDSSAAAACRSFSDTSSEICLLLALHVIRMSEQKPLAGAAL